VQVLSIEYTVGTSCAHEVLVSKYKEQERGTGFVFLVLSLYQTLRCITPPSFALPNIGPVKWALLLGYAGRPKTARVPCV
jgi:hypothetical protein